MAALDGCAVQCEREGNWGRDMYRNCFWDRFWEGAGQSLVTVPEVFATVNSAQFSSRFKSGACLEIINDKKKSCCWESEKS